MVAKKKKPYTRPLYSPSYHPLRLAYHIELALSRVLVSPILNRRFVAKKFKKDGLLGIMKLFVEHPDLYSKFLQVTEDSCKRIIDSFEKTEEAGLLLEQLVDTTVKLLRKKNVTKKSFKQKDAVKILRNAMNEFIYGSDIRPYYGYIVYNLNDLPGLDEMPSCDEWFNSIAEETIKHNLTEIVDQLD